MIGHGELLGGPTIFARKLSVFLAVVSNIYTDGIASPAAVVAYISVVCCAPLIPLVDPVDSYGSPYELLLDPPLLPVVEKS